MKGITFRFQLPNSIHGISKFDILIYFGYTYRARFAMSKVEFLSGYIPFSSVKLIDDCLLRAVATC